MSLPLHEVQGTPEMASVSSLPSAGAQVGGKGLGEGSLTGRRGQGGLSTSKMTNIHFGTVRLLLGAAVEWLS